MKHGARGKKQTLKSASTDLGTTDVGESALRLPPDGPTVGPNDKEISAGFPFASNEHSEAPKGAVFSFLTSQPVNEGCNIKWDVA